MAPVINGMWKHHEAIDGTYSFSDLLDAHEIMMVKYENEKRAMDAMQREV
jgi:hypothetical protein